MLAQLSLTQLDFLIKKLNTEIRKAIVASGKKVGLRKRYIYTSGIMTYGDQPGKVVDEYALPDLTNMSASERKTAMQERGVYEQETIAEEGEYAVVVRAVAAVVHAVVMVDVQDQQQGQQQSSTIQPYYALYKVPPSQIQSCFNVWAKSLWFAPSEFMSSVKFTQIQAIYTPFWIFSCNSTSNYSAQLSHYEKSTSSKKRVEVWDRSSGSLRSRHKDVIFLGDVTVSSAVQSLILEIDDWDYFKANLREPPAQTVASKIRIDRYMEMSKAWSIVSQRLVSAQQEECKKKIKKDENAEKMSDFDIKVEFSEVTGQLVFLPCYIAMYKYEDAEYFFVVSGQTGTTRGQRPYGLGKLGSIGKSLGGMFFGGSPKKT